VGAESFHPLSRNPRSDADGIVEYQLTPEGARVARQLAMSDEEGQDALMAALLEHGT